MRARLKRADDALHRVHEEQASGALQQTVLELELDGEIHIASRGRVDEFPIRVEVFERTIDIGCVDLVRGRIELNPAEELFAEHFEAHDHIGVHQGVVALVLDGLHAGGNRPRNEIRIARHVSDKVVHLLRRVGQLAGLGMAWHGPLSPFRLAGHVINLTGDCKVPGGIGGEMAQQSYTVDKMISAKAIAARIEELSREIEAEFGGTDKLVVVGLLRGSFVFIADLVREIDLPVEVDFLEASSYGNAMESSREVRILKDLRGEIQGRDVLVVEDIVDTGHTLKHVVGLLAQREPARMKTIALLDKPTRREVDIRADWTGFEIPDEFVVGYGIDYAQRNRNLPYIGKVSMK